MRYLAEGILFLGFVAMVLLFVWVAILRPARQALRRRKLSKIDNSPWVVDYDDDGVNTIVQIAHPNEPPYFIARIPISALDYDEQLDWARINAQDKANARNRRLPA